MKYFMKGTKMRMQVDLAPGMSSAGIADYAKKKIYMLMPHSKSYTEVDIDENAVPTTPEADAPATLKETDVTENILGYTCSKIISEKENDLTEIWIAKGFGKFYQPELKNQNPTLLALKEKFETENAFPFRIVSFTPDRRELFRMEVTNVEKKDLDDALFQVPGDYKRSSPPELVK